MAPEEWGEQIQQARVLYLGENHRGAADHQLQAETLEALARQQRRPVVVAEMFQLLKADATLAYSQGKLNDEQLKTGTEWESRWGHPWELYLPVWQVCRKWQLPLLPLRPSSESSRQLGQAGVQGFTAEERQGLSPEPYEFGSDQEAMREILGGHASHDEAAFARFLRVQVLWEEFMAARVREALRRYPDSQVVVLVGKGHLVYGHGLPWRVQQGWEEPLDQKVILVNPEEEEQGRADLWWRSPAPP